MQEKDIDYNGNCPQRAKSDERGRKSLLKINSFQCKEEIYSLAALQNRFCGTDLYFSEKEGSEIPCAICPIMETRITHPGGTLQLLLPIAVAHNPPPRGSHSANGFGKALLPASE
jgi:hypothetical protein